MGSESSDSFDPPASPQRRPRGGQREKRKGGGGQQEEGPQALRQGPEGRPAPQVRVALEVTRGGSACGPPPEPDAWVTALTRAACASSEMSSTATQLVSCSYQRLTHCTYCSYVFVQLCYILHIMQLCFIQLCLHTSLFAAVYKKCSDRYLMFRSVQVLFFFSKLKFL